MSEALAKNLRVHPGHDTGRMGFAEVGIALHHGEGSVAKDLRNLGETGTAHRQIAGRAVAEIMAAEVRNACLFQGRFPSAARIKRLRPLGSGKHQRGIAPTHLGMLSHLVQSTTGQGHSAARGIFRIVAGDAPVGQLDIRPVQVENLPFSGSCRQSDEHHQRESSTREVRGGMGYQPNAKLGRS